jgi:hypothetical protein
MQKIWLMTDDCKNSAAGFEKVIKNRCIKSVLKAIFKMHFLTIYHDTQQL